ncbi:MAG TPA: UDP-3-O-(3-hydroxymyristoyl)glucosamine N-acyltransferase [Vicinamibacteria bacterium]|nr:UDP-3-O-(3-hydroxymyristoyl)glucosamine N-acyltransferase [Vicinamibacteria bacterium]
MKLRELAGRLGCELLGDGEVEIRGVSGLERAGPGDLTFLANPRYAPLLATTRAAAVIVASANESTLPRLVSENPYLAFARAVGLICPPARPEPGVHPSAQVHPTAVLGTGVHVGALAVVGARARVGARSVLHPQVVVYDEVTIGEDCLLHSGVQVRERCRLGDRVIVQNGAVIGGDGFGFARDAEGRYHKFPQVGTVVIEDDVEIGALTAVDRAALGETRIGRGSKLDNLVQVGHSVTVGSDTVLCGQVGIAGSSRVGSGVTLAGQVGVAGHLTIGDRVIATAQTGIPSSVEPGTVVSGYPAIENRAWLRSSALFARLPELQKRVRELERRLESLLSRGRSGPC